MSGVDVSKVVEIFFIGWMVALFSVVMIKLLRGDINMAGLLNTPQVSNSDIDLERLVLVISTLIAAIYYIMLTMEMTCFPDVPGCRLPDVPDELLMILGGSHSAYLTGKIFRQP